MSEKTILIVEDEQPLAEAIKIKLEKNSFAVVVARSAEQVLNYLKDLKKVDAIWLDHYLLGKETGLDILTRVKNDESPWKTVPVFVVSNTASDDKVKAYLELGVEKYYVKAEVKLDDVVEAIKEKMENINS